MFYFKAASNPARAPAADDARPPLVRQIVHIGHLCILGIRRAQLTRMAAALTYRTIFSLIPVMVISLVVLAAFASKDMVGSAVESLLKFAGLSNIVVTQPGGLPGADGPLPQTSDATHLDSWIAGLVAGIHNLPFKTIGFVGVLTLIYAAVSMLVEIENAFNDIYHAPTGRSWTRRVTQYWTLLTLGAIFLFASFSVTDRVMKWVEALPDSSLMAMIDRRDADSTVDPGAALAATPAMPVQAAAATGASTTDPSTAAPVRRPRSAIVQTVVTGVGFIISVTISTILFFGVYATVPNTRVHVGPAMIGAVFAATLWEAGKWGFTTYLKYSTGYSQFYGTMALLPLFLMWVYVTWIIVLLGLQIAHSMQTYRTATSEGFSDSVFETLGLIARKVTAAPLRLLDPSSMVLVMAVVAERFQSGKPTDHGQVANSVGIDDHSVSQMLEKLAGAGLVHRLSDEDHDGTYTLARPPERIGIDDILQIAYDSPSRSMPAPASRLLDELAAARRQAVAGKTLADVIDVPDRRDAGTAAGVPGGTMPASLPQGA